MSLEKIKARMQAATPLDCGDNSCLFKKSSGGMRTNGGCRCWENAGYSRSVMASNAKALPDIMQYRQDIDRLVRTVEVMREALEYVKKKDPKRVNQFEAADIACEFHQRATKSLAEADAILSEEK